MKSLEIHAKSFSWKLSFYAIIKCLKIMAIIKIINGIIIG